MANKKEYFYFIDTHSAGEKIAIVQKATNAVTKNGWTSQYQTVQTAGTNILKIRGIFTDNDLATGTLDGKYSNIPTRFHHAIVMNVISMGYLDPRNMNVETAKVFAMGYDDGLKKAKRFARSNYISTGRVAAQDF